MADRRSLPVSRPFHLSARESRLEAALAEDEFPSHSAKRNMKPEEEKRLFHVARACPDPWIDPE